MPRRKGFYSLKKPRIRQSWNKHNLYNLWNLQPLFVQNKTFFQQKWAAKSLTRGYHGEQIRERAWNHLFSRYIPSAVPMDPKVLARGDGADMAEGTGAGKSKKVVEKIVDKSKITPYMGMVYWPMERRLDTAIFRAMFASSARQARQFVVHGSVKVNGKKMRYPGYLLNPGDMFSVDPERVLFATGKHKGDKTYRSYQGSEQQEAQEDEEEEGQEEDIEEEEAEPEYELPFEEPNEPSRDPMDERKKALTMLRKELKEFEAKEKDNLSGKRKQQLRTLQKESKKLLAKLKTVDDTLIETFQAELSRIVGSIAKSRSVSEFSSASTTALSTQAGQLTTPVTHTAALATALRNNTYNPLKPYKTPWEPRPLMSAFAFIPRYLEVNQNVCSAVYLRHPVARPGLAEVPSPFPTEVSQLAHNWYLRRR